MKSAPLVLAFALAAGALIAGAPVRADEAASLTGLRDVSLSVELAHPLRTMTAGDLTAHVVRVLRAAERSLTIQDGRTDRIRVIVSVRPVSATTLRGFWLPFSGTYGIGAVRLGVERVVALPDGRSFPALVWQRERTVSGPWEATDEEITRLIDEMVAELTEAPVPPYTPR